MTAKTHTIELRGCAPVPLMAYLKSLGVLKVVNRFDSTFRVWWRGNILCGSSVSIDSDSALVQEILERYCPTPVLAPWNGGCGFFKKWDPKKAEFKTREAAEALESIEHSTAQRFSAYRAAIAQTRTALVEFSTPVNMQQELDQLRNVGTSENWSNKKLNDEIKSLLDSVLLLEVKGTARRLPKTEKDEWLLTLRGQVLGDETLQWLDSAVVLLEGEKKNRAETPLLGSAAT